MYITYVCVYMFVCVYACIHVLCVCVHVCLYGWVHGWLDECVTEARGCRVSCSITVHLILMRQGLVSQPGGELGASRPCNPLVPTPRCPGLQAQTTVPGFSWAPGVQAEALQCSSALSHSPSSHFQLWAAPAPVSVLVFISLLWICVISSSKKHWVQVQCSLIRMTFAQDPFPNKAVFSVGMNLGRDTI